MQLILCITLFGVMFLSLYFSARSEKHVKNNRDYFNGGGNVTFFPLFMTFLATQVGGGMILGAAEEAYTSGALVFLYPMGVALGLIILGLGIGKRLSSLKVTTVAEIFQVKYKSPRLRKIASLVSIFSLFMILVAQMVATQKFFLSFGIASPAWYLLFWFLAISYTVRGGMKGVIAADIVQALFFLTIFAGALFYTYLSDVSFSLPSVDLTATPKMWGWLIMPLLFMLIEQGMAQRCFAGKSPSVVRSATITAGIVAFITALVPIFFGILAKNYAITILPGSSVLISSVAYFTNPFVTALLGVAVLLAIASTAVAMINAISSNFVSDFHFFAGDSIKKAKRVTIIVSLAALIFSFYAENVLDLLIQSYELSIATLFAPIMIALFRKHASYQGARGAILLGIVGFILIRVYPLPVYFPKELLAPVLSFLGYFLFKAPKERDINEGALAI
ncbi:MAG: sodium:solute symporter family protein [Verrucomicrobia bacterium]|nr:sodium:solute symporter family protein [Verrucomicrobiota bacterium]